jgi:hypothetical protein
MFFHRGSSDEQEIQESLSFPDCWIFRSTLKKSFRFPGNRLLQSVESQMPKPREFSICRRWQIFSGFERFCYLSSLYIFYPGKFIRIIDNGFQPVNEVFFFPHDFAAVPSAATLFWILNGLRQFCIRKHTTHPVNR